MEIKDIRSTASVSESNFFLGVYRWMAFGLILSAAGAIWLLSQPALLQVVFTNKWLFFGLIIAELAMVIWLSAAAQTMAPGLMSLLFCGYSFLNGVTLSAILLIYTGASVATTFAVTAGTFLFFSAYGVTTKKDLTGLGSLAMMGLIGVIIASVVNIFLKSSGLMWVMTFVGIAVFLALIAYDTQKLKAIHAAGLSHDLSMKRLVILGALTLYLDFINLFILLLRIFGKRRD